MRQTLKKLYVAVFFMYFVVYAMAGPYRSDPGINGYIGPDYKHANPITTDPNVVVNPIFQQWAASVWDYSPAKDGDGTDSLWKDSSKSLGPATGDVMDIVSLGELTGPEIVDGNEPGAITLYFAEPVEEDSGYEIAVFENAFVSNYNTDDGSISGQSFCELGFVEVSSNGVDFARFNSVSLTPAPQGPQVHATIDVTNFYRLAGKHPNAYGFCVGTPFDLAWLGDNPLVTAGIVDINNIRYVRIVDIPGGGFYDDNAPFHIDPLSWPLWDYYPQPNPIYDPHPTSGSGGFDLDAVGTLHPQQYSADINLDGMVDFGDFALLAGAHQSRFGDPNYVERANLNVPGDFEVTVEDAVVFCSQWLSRESWRQ